MWLDPPQTKRRGTRSERSTRGPYKSRRRLFWRLNWAVPQARSRKSAATMLQRCDRTFTYVLPIDHPLRLFPVRLRPLVFDTAWPNDATPAVRFARLVAHFRVRS